MFYIIKFGVYFIISFAILCIPIKDRTIFSYLYEFSAPYADKAYKMARPTVVQGLDKAKKAGKQLLSNSTPPEEDQKRSTASLESSKGQLESEEKEQRPQDSHTKEDEDFIKEITKK